MMDGTAAQAASLASAAPVTEAAATAQAPAPKSNGGIRQAVFPDPTESKDNKPDFDIHLPDEDAEDNAQSESGADEDEAEGSEVDANADAEKARSSSEISRELMARAEQAGMSAEDITAIGSDKGLKAVLAHLEKFSQRQQAQELQEKAKTDPPKDEGFKLALTPEEEDQYDPVIVKNLKGMNDHYNRQTSELRQQLQQSQAQLDAVLQDFRQRHDAALRERIDGLFEGAAEQFGDVFGKGQMEALDQKSDHAGNRLKVLAKMDMLQSGYLAAKQKMPAEKELFSEAMRIAFPENPKKSARQEISKGLQKREGQILPRGAVKTPKAEEFGDEKAIEGVKNFLEKLERQAT